MVYMTENYEADFVDLTPIDVEIGGRKFKLKPLNGEESDKVTNKFTKFVQDKDNPDEFKADFDISVRNSEWLKICVIDAPYSKGEKAWSELNEDEKLEILNKLKPKLRNELLKQIRIMNSLESEVVKNSK